MHTQKKAIFAAGAALLLAAPVSSFAATPAVTVTGTATTLGNPPYTLGFDFTTSTSFTVDGLGFYDDSSDGLADSHQVGLWNSSGDLLASATVDSGTTDSLIDGFRYVSITQFTIAAGTYDIGALFVDGNDPVFFPGDGAVSSVPGFTYVDGTYASGGTLSDPTNVGGGAASYIGPNLLVSASVPEPTSWAMMLLGCGLVGATLRSRRSSKVRVTYA